MVDFAPCDRLLQKAYRGSRSTGGRRRMGGKQNFDGGRNWKKLKKNFRTLRNIL